MLVTSAVLLTIAGVLLAINFTGGEKKIQRRIERSYALDDPRFAHELGALLGPPFVRGNRPKVLRNGDEIFPAMLAAIRGSRTSITFETYIYWSGDIGREFATALVERAQHGVKVHVLLDWVGSAKMDEALINEMVSAGVQVRRFHPPHWSHLARLNNRTHRKLLVVDGKTAFTGGVGIAPQWTGRAQDPDHWRDTHFQIEGPVVAQMQAVFLDNWIKATGNVLHGPDYFPSLEAGGSSQAQMFSSSPTGGSESMQLMYLLAITAASHSIDLSASYFVPDELVLRALADAMKRGVRLRIVVPGEHIDSETVRSASRATWGSLLAAGAVIAEYEPTMFHPKTMVVDGIFSTVGSANFDERSFHLNEEINVFVYDTEFAARMRESFQRDLEHCHEYTLAMWNARPVSKRITEWLIKPFRSEL